MYKHLTSCKESFTACTNTITLSWALSAKALNLFATWIFCTAGEHPRMRWAEERGYHRAKRRRHIHTCMQFSLFPGHITSVKRITPERWENIEAKHTGSLSQPCWIQDRMMLCWETRDPCVHVDAVWYKPSAPNSLADQTHPPWHQDTLIAIAGLALVEDCTPVWSKFRTPWALEHCSCHQSCVVFVAWQGTLSYRGDEVVSLSETMFG